jgi:hypothetical protein
MKDHKMLVAAITFMAFFAPALHAVNSSLLDRGYYDMYNLNFQGAHQRFHEWEQQHPKDAMGPVSDAAAYLFSELNRLHILQSDFLLNDSTYLNRKRETPDPQVKAKFDADLSAAAQLAAATLKTSPDDKDAQLANVLRLGLASDYAALIEKQNVAALSQIKSATALAEKLLRDHPDCYDAHLAAGIQNYLLSLKPAPVRWLLRITGAQTDKEKGLANFRLVAEKGHYLQPYAKLLLAVAELRDHHDEQARQLLTELSTNFPQNRLYRNELKKLS